MTVTKAHNTRLSRRPFLHLAGAIGMVAGLLAGAGSVQASTPSILAMSQSGLAAVDPARAGATVSVAGIDFKRGDGGSGKLVIRFSGDGASPDLRTQGDKVVIDVANATLGGNVQRAQDVGALSTPVSRLQASQRGSGTQFVLDTRGGVETMAYQTGRDYVVEVLPRAGGAAAAPGERAMGQTVYTSGPARTVAAPVYRGKPVTFNFQDVPVRTVLQLIAEESGLNIVASDTVQGNVTLRLVNVPWDQALDIVLQARSLDKRRSGNVVWVAPQSEIAKYEQDKEDARINLENRAELITEFVPVSYASAEDIAKLLTDNAKGGAGGAGNAASVNQNRGFLSPRGSISADQRTNTLLVIDIPQRVAQIKQLVAMLDKPVDQVVIEGRIVIANESFARELGAKFGISGVQNNGRIGFNSSTANNIASQNSYNDPARTGPWTLTHGTNVSLPATLANAGSLALSILNGGYALDVEFSALQTEGRGEVISNPRIVTSNQKEAVIKQGREIGYLTITGGAGGSSIPQVQFKEALLELRVTPTITNDGRVFLNMVVKKDELNRYIDTGFGQVPELAKREVNTAVLMEDGQTVVVGGVYEFNDQQDLSKIPFLGDLPVIGNLFKKRGRNKSKAELLIFVTPKVIRVAQR